MSSTPFYESKIGKIIGQRVVNTANGITPQIEYTSIENGTIKGVGNVTNLQTWTDTIRPPRIIYGVGQGVITTQMDRIWQLGLDTVMEDLTLMGQHISRYYIF